MATTLHAKHGGHISLAHSSTAFAAVSCCTRRRLAWRDHLVSSSMLCCRRFRQPKAVWQAALAPEWLREHHHSTRYLS